MRGASVAAVVVIVASAGVVGAGQPARAAVPDDPRATDATVRITQQLQLTPDRPGEIDVRWTFDIPPEVSELSTRLPPGAADVRTDGFGAADDRRYEWDSDTDGPAVTFTVETNETSQFRGPESADGHLVFADTGEWAITKVYRVPVGFTFRRGANVSVVRENTSAGPGVVGGALAYLGAHEVVRRSAADQQFRLVVPAAADLRPSPDRVLDSVAAAAERLRIGDRDRQVLMIAAPTSVDWAVEGLERGERDLYVTADEPVDEPANTWVHEYVHTRQDFNVTSRTQWLIEATAQYYAGQFTLGQQRIDFPAFVEYLRRGADSRFEDIVLTDQSTWQRNAGQYYKGALVVGDLDRRISAATDGEANLQDALRRMNDFDGAVTHDQFLEWIDAAGGADIAGVADRYADTDASPEMWSREAHQAAFGRLAASMRYRLSGSAASFRVTGPYRNASFADIPGVVVNETITANVTVTNVGGREGAYNLTLRADDRVADVRTGRLGPGESTTVPVRTSFRNRGTHTLAVAENRWNVTVRPPASLSLTGLQPNRSTASVGARIGLAISVSNPGDRPGRAEFLVRRGGDPAGRVTVHLAAGGAREVTVPVALPSAGTHTLSAGNRSVAVTARTPSRTPTPTGERTRRTTGDVATTTGDATTPPTTETGEEPSGTTGASGPGFGVTVLLTAGLLLLVRRVAYTGRSES
ncbi:MAG: hypothetical protein ABEH56_03445 [Salinirussus sp.]